MKHVFFELENDDDEVKPKEKIACVYCGKEYVSERAFAKHTCKEKDRAEQIKTPEGIAAYEFYKIWMRKRKYRAGSLETFTSSRHYNAFINFAKFIKITEIKMIDEYIDLMMGYMDGGLDPIIWSKDFGYKLYQSWLDAQCDPILQVEQTVIYISRYCETRRIDMKDFFNSVTFNQYVQWIRKRTISPWFALLSPHSISFIVDNPSVDEHDIQQFYKTIGGQELWTNIFDDPKNDRLVADIREICSIVFAES